MRHISTVSQIAGVTLLVELGIKNMIGEVLLFGFEAEVVVPNPLPVIEEQASKTSKKEERQTYSQ